MSGDTTPRLNEGLSDRLATFLQRAQDARSVRIDGLRLLTGGASRQTWSFDAVIERADGTSQKLALVLRMDPRTEAGQMSRETEFELLKAAYEESVPFARGQYIIYDTLGHIRCLIQQI